jgi:RNA polymerase sigma factor (TIGR02999 family)
MTTFALSPSSLRSHVGAGRYRSLYRSPASVESGFLRRSPTRPVARATPNVRRRRDEFILGERTLSQERFEPTASAGEIPRQLFTKLYEELRQIAHRELRRRGSALSLGTTTLLHEAYLDMQARDGLAFPDRARFLAYASRAMRGLIIDYARSRQAVKRGGDFEFTALPTNIPEEVADSEELQRTSDAIDRLAAIDPRLAQVVDLKFFCGFSFTDIAALWGMSERTVQRDWDKARLLLHRYLSETDVGSRSGAQGFTSTGDISPPE